MGFAPNDLFVLLFILQKEQLQRLQFLKRESESLVAAIQYLDHLLGVEHSPAGYSEFSAASADLLSIDQERIRNPRSQIDPGHLLETTLYHALETYDHFIALRGNDNTPLYTGHDRHSLLLERDQERETDLDRRDEEAIEPGRRLFIFLRYHSKNTRELRQTLNLFSRIRSRLSQELEQYPMHVHVLPRYHNRESNTCRRFLQNVAVEYDNTVRHLLTRIIQDPKELDNPPRISLTFDYNLTSNLQTEPPPPNTLPRNLLIESPYFFLDRPKYAPVLAHEVAHAYVNSLLFTPLGEKLLTHRALTILREMETELSILYATRTPLLNLVPQIARHILAELFADTLAVLTSGPHFLFGLLISTAGPEEPAHRIHWRFSRIYRLRVLCEVCKSWRSRGKHQRPLWNEHLALLEGFADSYHKTLLQPPPRSPRPSTEYAQVAGFFDAACSILVPGFRRLLHELVPDPTENTPYVFSKYQPNTPGRNWIRNQIEQATIGLSKPETEFPQLSDPLKDSHVGDLLRIIPDSLWDESIKWTTQKTDRTNHWDDAVFTDLPGEGRCFHFARNILQDQISRQTSHLRPAGNTCRLLGSHIVRMRHYSFVPNRTNGQSEPFTALLELTEQVDKWCKNKKMELERRPSQTATKVRNVFEESQLVSFGPSDLIVLTTVPGYSTLHDLTVPSSNERRYGLNSTTGEDENGWYYRDHYYALLDKNGNGLKPSDETSWQALLHLRLERQAGGGGPINWDGTKSPGLAQRSYLKTPLLNAEEHVSTICETIPGLAIRQTLIGQGYWDLVFLLDLTNIKALPQFYTLVRENLSDSLNRTLLLPSVVLPEDPIERESLILGKNTIPVKPPDAVSSNEPVVVVSGVQAPQSEANNRARAVSGGQDITVTYKTQQFFPEGVADSEAARSFLATLQCLFKDLELTSCESAFQINREFP